MLDKKSKLRNFFEKEKETICVAFYADTHQTLNIIANNFLRDIKLSLSQQSINLIIEKSNGSRQHLQNELEKINSLSLTNKKIEINQIMKITNLGNQNTISELIDFDDAIGAALDFAEKDGNTLVIVTADHETGGFTLAATKKINDAGKSYNDYSEIMGVFSTGGHSATLIPVFAFGPGAESFSGIYENSEIFQKIMEQTQWK